MADFSEVLLTGSTDGVFVNVVATASPGTVIHTAATAEKFDHIHLWASNVSTANKKLTVEFGSTISLIEVTIPFEDGLYTVVPGLPLTGAKVCRAFATATDVIFVGGYVVRRST